MAEQTLAISQLISDIENSPYHVSHSEILYRLKAISNIPVLQNKEKILFRDLVKRNTSHEVLRAPPELVERIRTYGRSHVGTLLTDCRINESGNKMEECMILKNPDKFQRTRTNENKIQLAGYPDLGLHKVVPEEKGTLPEYNISLEAYVEVKIYKAGSEENAMRAFYMSSFTKITKTCPHLLIGFSHDGEKITGFEVVDLHDIELNVKVEYNASNRDMYPQTAKPTKPKKTPLPATYTLEEITAIRDSTMKNREKQGAYRELIQKHNLIRCGRSAQDMYESLEKHWFAKEDG